MPDWLRARATCPPTGLRHAKGTALAARATSVAALAMCARFFGYVVSIVRPVVGHRPGRPGDATAFEWHFMIPCLNEEAVIGPTVQRLISGFPAAQVWCVDDASGDDTPEILGRAAADDTRVHVVSRRWPEAHEGKGPALNAAWRAVVAAVPPAERGRVIVGTLDADGALEPRCLDILSGTDFFGNSQINGVQIKVRIVDDEPRTGRHTTRRSHLFARMQDLEFTGPIAGMQMLRRRVGTASMGGAGQFTRLSALMRIAEDHGTPWHQSLLEDYELGLHLLMTGGRTEYCHHTWVAQEGPATLSGLIRQRSRWVQGTIQCSRYLWPVWRSPWISRSGRLEITKFLCGPWLQAFTDLIAMALLTELTFRTALGSGPSRVLSGGGVRKLIALFVVIGMARRVVWGPVYRCTHEPELTIVRASVLGLAGWLFASVDHLATWWAITRTLRRRSDWKRTEHRGARGIPSPMSSP